MMTAIYLGIGILLLVILTVIGLMTRYKKCGSDEVLVVYGKTKGNGAAKCYHGGATFVWPIIQGWDKLSMKPMQIQCDLTGALSAQKINVNVPTVVTVAISEEPEVMQNAAIRLLSMTSSELEEQVKDIIWGQMRLVIAEMTVEELISDRDKFLGSCNQNITVELQKIGMKLLNINISDISDDAEYIENLGKEAAAKARNEALASIEKREKEGSIGIANEKKQKDIALSEIERDRQISVASNTKDREIQTAEIRRDQETTTSETEKKKAVQLRNIEKDREVELRGLEKEQTVSVAEQAKEEAVQTSEIEKSRAIEVATNETERDQKVAEQDRIKNSEVAKQHAERDTAIAAANAERDAKVAEKKAESMTAQKKAEYEASASIEEAKKTSEARQVAADEKAQAEIEKARQEKTANVSQYESDTRSKKADFEKTAKVNENNAQIEIAKSEASLGEEKAQAKQKIGEAEAKSQEAIGKAQAQAAENVAQAEAEAVKAKINAETIVPAEKEKERLQIEADGYKAKVTTEAKADAEAIKLKAQAEAEAIRLRMVAEAEGQVAMAKAKKEAIAAETANIVALKESGMSDEAIVNWTLKEEYKLIAEADAKKFEKITTGNVTVIGGTDTASNFILDTVKAVQQFRGAADMVPGMSGLFGKLENFDEKNKIESKDSDGFEEVK